jgi:hypothetical protein
MSCGVWSQAYYVRGHCTNDDPSAASTPSPPRSPATPAQKLLANGGTNIFLPVPDANTDQKYPLPHETEWWLVQRRARSDHPHACVRVTARATRQSKEWEPSWTWTDDDGSPVPAESERVGHTEWRRPQANPVTLGRTERRMAPAESRTPLIPPEKQWKGRERFFKIDKRIRETDGRSWWWRWTTTTEDHADDEERDNQSTTLKYVTAKSCRDNRRKPR